MDLHVYTNDDEFVIAASPDDAKAVMIESGCFHESDEQPSWRQMSDAQPFTADLDTGDGPVKKTCGEWAKERGRGYFCAANY
jgi:hypothetical protein